MTVLAWDGITLAADKRAVMDGLTRTTTKIFRINGCLVGYSGESAFGEAMLDWFRRGEKPDDFPDSQRDMNTWAGLLVIREDGKIQRYEQAPYPITFEDSQIAVGSGRDYALAAMYCGRNAHDAVLIACEFDNGCGNGVDTLRLDGCDCPF